jgi:N-acetylglucosaminyl-diphospho-decaprenol L-rhamnosyltransferase
MGNYQANRFASHRKNEDMTSSFPSIDSSAQTDVSVVIVSYNSKCFLAPVLTALEAGQGELRLQVIVVDNASRDGSAEFIKKEFPNVKLVQNPVNEGFGRANNLAMPMIRGRYVLLLNPDAFVSSDTLSKSVTFMDKNIKCGVLGVKLIGEDGALKPSCCYFPTPWNVALHLTRLDRYFPKTRFVYDMTWDHASVRACDWVPGCFYMVRREVIDAVGLFDPRYFLYCEETDHCRRVREAGWEIIYFPYTEVVHIGGQSARTFDEPTNDDGQVAALQTESLLLYFRKHHGLAGMMAIALLTILTDVSAAIKRTFRQDAKQARERLKHAQLVSKILRDTRLASRPTR